jgi:tRNA1Val (adenine37-N6)-methyltransferase
MSQFQFKQFSIEQDRCAMKIGTDGVPLALGLPNHNPFSILDIGTGTGVIALMLAQRSNAQQIDALKLTKAPMNKQQIISKTPWSDRLFCYHAGLDEFVEEPEDEYDLIVSNPPTEDYKTDNEQRDLAHQDAMPLKI